MHYQRWRKHGTPMADVPPLGRAPFTEKKCSGCLLVKPISEFYRHAKYGSQSHCKVCRKVEKRRRYWASPDAYRERSRVRYRDNSDALKAQNAAWKKANPSKVAANVERRRSRKSGAPINDLTNSDWLAILDKSGHRCSYCGTQERLTQDHVVPLSRGGSHTRTNVVPACRSCNSRKGALTAAEFLLRKEEVNRIV